MKKFMAILAVLCALTALLAGTALAMPDGYASTDYTDDSYEDWYSTPTTAYSQGGISVTTGDVASFPLAIVLIAAAVLLLVGVGPFLFGVLVTLVIVLIVMLIRKKKQPNITAEENASQA